MDYSFIGKIAGTHGLDGGLIFFHRFGKKNKLLQLKHVFIELNPGSYIPFFIVEKKVLNEEEIRFRFDEVDSKEAARELSGKSVYMEENLFRQLHPQTVDETMEGFMIIDEKLGTLGAINSLVETPGQVLAVIQYQQKEVLIPLIDATIKLIDPIKRTITVSLPDGLLEVYM